MMRRKNLAALFLSCTLTALACEGEEDRPPPPGRGVRRTSSDEPAAPPSTVNRRRPARGPGRRGNDAPARLSAAEAAAGAQNRAAPSESESAEPAPRAAAAVGADEPGPNLSAALRGAIGDPSTCLATSTQQTGSITVGVRATVVATGRITRAEITPRSLSRDIVLCIQRRVVNKTLPGPIPTPPTTVTTNFRWDWAATP